MAGQTLTGQTSDDINKQVTDLKSSQVRKIREFSKANDWTALEAYALNHLDKQKFSDISQLILLGS